MYGKLEIGSSCGLFQVSTSICFEGEMQTGKIIGIVNVDA
jgi:hypothetical protein